MASIDLIRASNGSGDAVKATVANARVISSTTLQVDATTNWPSKFIATVGDVDGTGAFVPATVTVFNGILSGGNIEITSFAPGYTDLGNAPGQIVVLKPTTAWSNEVASTLGVAHDDNGSLKANSVTSTALADSNVTTPKIANASVTADKIDFTTFMDRGLVAKNTSTVTKATNSSSYSPVTPSVVLSAGLWALWGKIATSWPASTDGEFQVVIYNTTTSTVISTSGGGAVRGTTYDKGELRNTMALLSIADNTGVQVGWKLGGGTSSTASVLANWGELLAVKIA